MGVLPSNSRDAISISSLTGLMSSMMSSKDPVAMGLRFSASSIAWEVSLEVFQLLYQLALASWKTFHE